MNTYTVPVKKLHYRGNAEGSTLRLTLGALLAKTSDFPLRRVGSGRRMTFTHLGEQWLDQWMAELGDSMPIPVGIERGGIGMLSPYSRILVFSDGKR